MAHSAFDDVTRYFTHAAKVLRLDAKVAQYLATPARELKVECNVRMDDGTVSTPPSISITPRRWRRS
jgi:glutamate dehydrogenase (NAD(P)+)